MSPAKLYTDCELLLFLIYCLNYAHYVDNTIVVLSDNQMFSFSMRFFLFSLSLSLFLFLLLSPLEFFLLF